ALALATGAGATVAIQRVTAPDPRPATVAVRPCAVVDPLSGTTSPPRGSPPSVRLPEQVRLPPGAAVFQYRPGLRVIGRAGDPCTAGGGQAVNSITVRRGSAWTGVFTPVTLGDAATSTCLYFPTSPQADRLRAQGRDCVSDAVGLRDLPTGVPGLRAALSAPVGSDLVGRPPSPYADAALSVLHPGDGGAATVYCTLPWSQADTCTAALTYFYVEAAAEAGAGKAALDEAARLIADHVAASRR
ncbi:MAG TPA: hypothetical protein VHJ17_20320, partial [Thermomonospora sp.]|nr:hypothetical protein [Thermomonospora sp.]